MSLIEKIDILLLKYIEKGKKPDLERRFLDSLEHEQNTKRELTRIKFMDAIDTKSSALLTHVSLMIATVSWGGSAWLSHKYVSYVVVGHILAYLFIALLCLRCIRLLTPEQWDRSGGEYAALAEVETYFRRKLYVFSLNATVIVTLVLFISTALIFVLTASNLIIPPRPPAS